MTIYRAGEFLTFHDTLVGKNQYFGYDHGIPFVSSGKRERGGSVYVSRFISGRWSDKYERTDLAHALHAHYEYDRNISADDAARVSGYHSMSHVQNPTGYIHFT